VRPVPLLVVVVMVLLVRHSARVLPAKRRAVNQ
jgi:hypothetical protein